jgi:hypothetical protein
MVYLLWAQVPIRVLALVKVKSRLVAASALQKVIILWIKSIMTHPTAGDQYLHGEIVAGGVTS